MTVTILPMRKLRSEVTEIAKPLVNLDNTVPVRECRDHHALPLLVLESQSKDTCRRVRRCLPGEDTVTGPFPWLPQTMTLTR